MSPPAIGEPDYLPLLMPGGVLLRYQDVSGEGYCVVGRHLSQGAAVAAYLDEGAAGRVVAMPARSDVLVPRARLQPVEIWEILVGNGRWVQRIPGP